MLKIGQAVVDGRGGEHIDGLVLDDVEELPVARLAFARVVPLGSRVSEVVGLVDDDDIDLITHLLHLAGHEVGCAEKIGVVEDLEAVEPLEHFRKVSEKGRFPD